MGEEPSSSKKGRGVEIGGRLPTAADLAGLYTELTGKAATPEELAETEAALARIAEKFRALRSGQAAEGEGGVREAN